jgi:hypothetical protein
VSAWLDIREARERAGLRLALLRGFPSPWSQAARAIFELKSLIEHRDLVYRRFVRTPVEL